MPISKVIQSKIKKLKDEYDRLKRGKEPLLALIDESIHTEGKPKRWTR